MLRVCAWCRWPIGLKRGRPGVTHGICGPCGRRAQRRRPASPLAAVSRAAPKIIDAACWLWMISLYLILVSCLYRILVAEAGGAEAVRVTATAYCWREPAHRRWGDRNALGTSLRSRVEGLDQIAVDPRRIPLGSIVEIEGLGCRIATDTGGLIRGWRIDVHCQTLSGMRAWGMRAVAIKVIRRGWGGHRGTRERRPWAR